MRVPQVLVAREITKLKIIFLLLVFTKPGICHIYYLSETRCLKNKVGCGFVHTVRHSLMSTQRVGSVL